MTHETKSAEGIDDATRQAIEARFASIPLARTLGVKLARLAPGECDLTLEDRRDLDGIFECLHGGILTTLADSAIAFAALSGAAIPGRQAAYVARRPLRCAIRISDRSEDYVHHSRAGVEDPPGQS